jgi:hypothetical protein
MSSGFKPATNAFLTCRSSVSLTPTILYVVFQSHFRTAMLKLAPCRWTTTLTSRDTPSVAGGARPMLIVHQRPSNENVML